jgi:hypothetical protein
MRVPEVRHVVLEAAQRVGGLERKFFLPEMASV